MGSLTANATREQWRSRQGFILATVGSAVGIGNIWRFSYIAGENGGGAFLLIYLVCILLVGAPIIVAELALGRNAQGDAVSAFDKVAPGSRWSIAGWIGVVVGFVILSYYSVVAGWALKYFLGAVSGTLWQRTDAGFGAYFEDFIANHAEPIAWQFATLAMTMLVVVGGIRRGIEIVNRILVPLLALIVVSLAVFGLSLPGAAKGWSFLLIPSVDAFLRPDVYVAALGQAFFSLGVGMAVYITYGGYLPRHIPLVSSAVAIIVADSLFAVIAGLGIVRLTGCDVADQNRS
jgi:NSS family neurotransmitter:Na+ symporter